MARMKEKVEQVYGSAQPPLSDFARFAREGLDDKDYKFVESNGPKAARQLLRFVSELAANARCTSVEQFLLGVKPRDAAAAKSVGDWEKLVTRSFELAQITDWDEAGVREMAEQVVPLIREVAEFVYPAATAWGLTSATGPTPKPAVSRASD
jgi:hypothetical protein